MKERPRKNTDGGSETNHYRQLITGKLNRESKMPALKFKSPAQPEFSTLVQLDSYAKLGADVTSFITRAAVVDEQTASNVPQVKYYRDMIRNINEGLARDLMEDCDTNSLLLERMHSILDACKLLNGFDDLLHAEGEKPQHWDKRDMREHFQYLTRDHRDYLAAAMDVLSGIVPPQMCQKIKPYYAAIGRTPSIPRCGNER